VPRSFRSRCPKRKPRCRKGMTVRLTLDKAATVELRFKQRKRRRPRTFKVRKTAKAGANRLRFSGRVKRKPLPSGRYRLTITGTADGLTSDPVRRRIRVK
jgi:hypothetical protein